MSSRRTPERELVNRIANRRIRLALLDRAPRTIRSHDHRVALLTDLTEFEEELRSLAAGPS